MKFAWIDLRKVSAEHREAVIDAAVHARVDGIVDRDAGTLATLPVTVKRILADTERPEGEGLDDLIVLSQVDGAERLAQLRSRHQSGEKDVAGLVDVVDDPTLSLACETAIALPYTVVQFKDPTKIPDRKSVV